jgi:hypothetical protein
MTRAAGLTLIALGAILAFAVHAHPPFLNIQVAGWVILATGAAGMLIPRSGYDAVRRRIVRKRYSPAGQVTEIDEGRYPPYLRLNTASLSRGHHDEAELVADRDQNNAEAVDRIDDTYITADPPDRGWPHRHRRVGGCAPGYFRAACNAGTLEAVGHGSAGSCGSDAAVRPGSFLIMERRATGPSIPAALYQRLALHVSYTSRTAHVRESTSRSRPRLLGQPVRMRSSAPSTSTTRCTPMTPQQFLVRLGPFHSGRQNNPPSASLITSPPAIIAPFSVCASLASASKLDVGGT